MNSNTKSYYTKYIKYKNKYLQLKNMYQYGGWGEDWGWINKVSTVTAKAENLFNQKFTQNNLNILVGTHDNRVKCVCSSIGIEINRNIGTDEIPIIKEIKFKNCAVILFSFDKTNIPKLTVSLIYEGSISGDVNKNTNEHKYFTNDSNNKNLLYFETKEFINEHYTKALSSLHIFSDDFDKHLGNCKTLNIYMVRHAEGIHNKPTKIEKIIGFISSTYLDPELNKDGIQQANTLATNGILKNINFDYIFVSDLKRTRDTIGIILSTNTFLNDIKEFFILSCSHELDYIKNGKCDEGVQLTLIEDENKMNCNIKKDNTIDDICKSIQISNKNIKLNWDYYFEFYKNKTRSAYINPNRLHCRDTSLISLVIFIVSCQLKIKHKIVNSQNCIKNMDDWIAQRHQLPSKNKI
jgi:bisphosphoglycerate-dependent phosphoglycerate mutase